MQARRRVCGVYDLLPISVAPCSSLFSSHTSNISTYSALCPRIQISNTPRLPRNKASRFSFPQRSTWEQHETLKLHPSTLHFFIIPLDTQRGCNQAPRPPVSASENSNNASDVTRRTAGSRCPQREASRGRTSSSVTRRKVPIPLQDRGASDRSPLFPRGRRDSARKHARFRAGRRGEGCLAGQHRASGARARLELSVCPIEEGNSWAA